MAHSKMDRRSLISLLPLFLREGIREKESLVILISFFLILAMFAGAVSGEDNNGTVHQINVDGDDDAYQTWKSWSYYIENGTWPWEGASVKQNLNPVYSPDGMRLLLFNSWMFHPSEGGYQHLSESKTTITIRNVMSYAVGATMFKDSSINIMNCREVVIGAVFEQPFSHTKNGFVNNTQIVISNFERLWIYRFHYSKGSGDAVEIYGNNNSSVIIESLTVHPSVMVNSEGIVIRNAGLLRINSTIKITNHTPDLIIENVNRIEVKKDVVIDNLYYSLKDERWEKEGVGILTKSVKRVEGNGTVYIKNCDTGIAFENNGTGEGLNNSSCVVFQNCTNDYAYKYSYSSAPMDFEDIVARFQAITGVLVAVAWMRIGMWYMSDKREKKELAKDMMQKAAIGSVIVAIVVYGYPIMMSIVNYIFGG